MDCGYDVEGDCVGIFGGVWEVVGDLIGNWGVGVGEDGGGWVYLR